MQLSPFNKFSISLLSALTVSFAASASAQNLAVDLPSAPTGFGGGFGGPVVPLLDGLAFSASLSGVYDSNVRQGTGGGGDEEDFILSLGGSVAYQTQGPEWIIGATYRGSYDLYFMDEDLSGYNQGASFIAGYDGAKLKVMYNAGFDIDRGANRYYSSFAERINIRNGITASYRISPKTTINGNVGYSHTEANEGAFSDIEAFDFGLNALWQATPLLQIGPGVRYTIRTGDIQSQRETFGPTISANYTLSSKLALTSRIGLDFVDDAGGSSGPDVSALIGLNYRASALWGMNLSLYRDTQADPGVVGGFNEITTIALGYNRKIRRATLNLGATYEYNTIDQPGGTVSGSRDYIGLTSSLSMPIFANTTNASIFTTWRKQTAGAGQGSWDGFQFGFSLNRSF